MGRQRESLVVVLAAAVALGCAFTAQADTWEWVDPTGFETSIGTTPTVFDWYGGNTVTLTSTALASNLNYSVRTVTNLDANPDWADGSRDYFRVGYDNGSPSVGEITMTWDFSVPLTADDYMILGDWDWAEQVKVKAYDAENNLIAFSSFTNEDAPGAESSPVTNYYTFAAETDYSFVVTNTLYDAEADMLIGVQSDTAITRLVYELDLNRDYNSYNYNKMLTLNFAHLTPAAGDPVPEPATLSLLGIGLAGLVARRARRA